MIFLFEAFVCIMVFGIFIRLLFSAVVWVIVIVVCLFYFLGSHIAHAHEIHYKEPPKCIKHHPTAWCDYDGNRIYIRAIGN